MAEFEAFDRNLAVIIGINDYQNGIQPLTTAAYDAQILRQVLKDKYGYEIVDLVPEPTLDHFKILLQETLPAKFANTLEPQRRLLFYFAGHGKAHNGDDGPKGYLIPQNADPQDMDGTCLSMEDLHKELKALSCHHLLVILDCCFAGSFRWVRTRDISTEPEAIYKELFQHYRHRRAWQALTSSAHDQKAFDLLNNRDTGEPGKHSPFAEALLDALETMGADFTEDGIITAQELALYIDRELLKKTQDQRIPQKAGLWPLDPDAGEFFFLSKDFNPDNLADAPELNPENNPYQGLEAYGESRSDLFFGREELTRELYDKVKQSQPPLTVVLGISGSGKSSLVKAGLIPYLKQHDATTWNILSPMRPTAQPFQSLAIAIQPIAARDGLTKLLQADVMQLAKITQAWCTEHPDQTLLLVIDQFEELITLNQSPAVESSEAWQPFLAMLHHSLQVNQGQFRLVITLRSDFDLRFRESPLQNDWIAGRFLVRPMGFNELRRVVEKPAEKKVIFFENAELVNQLVGEVVQMPGALPLLSFTLSELYIQQFKGWQRGENSNRTITWENYRKLGGVAGKLGGVAGALSSRANDLYGQLLTEAHRNTMRRIMLRMVTLEGGEAVRRRVPRSELTYSNPEADSEAIQRLDEDERVQEVLSRLDQARLIVKGEQNGQEFVEPAHDFLVRDWDQMQKWITAEQENLALMRRLTLAANDWDGSEQGLWVEEVDRIIKLNSVIDSNNNWLNRLETIFIKSSKDVRQARINKLEDDLRISEQRRRVADSRQLAAQSQAVFRDYPQRALLLAIEALQVSLEKGDLPVVAAEQTLRDALSNAGGKPLQGHTRGVIVLTASPNNKWLVSTSDDGIIHLWDLESPDFSQPTVVLKHHEVRTATFSPDGQWLATGGGDGIVRLWDLTAENITTESRVFTHVAFVWSIAFSPDNRWLAAGTLYGGDARLWDLNAEDSNLNPIILHETRQTVTRIEFSQNNRWIAIGTQKTVMPEDNPFRSEGDAYLWNLQAQDISSSRQTLSGHQGAGVNGVTFSSDSRWLATAGDNGIARLWDLDDEDLHANSIPLHGGHKAAIRSIAFSPDNHWLATGSIDSTARLWDVKSGTPATTFMILRGHDRSGGDGLCLTFSSDGHWLATFGDKKALLWDLTSDNPADKPIVLRGHDSSILSATFSANSHWFLTGSSGGRDTSIRLWNLDSNHLNEMPLVLLGNKNDITSSTISPNKKWLLTESSDRTIHLWTLTAKDAASAPVVLSNNRNPVRVLAISSDKLWVVIIDEAKTTYLWNLETQSFKVIHQQREDVSPIMFSQNSLWLATCIDPNLPDQSRVTENTLCQLWDLTAPMETLIPISLEGHEKGISSITFSTNDRWLVTASEDQTARLWDLAIPKPSNAPIVLRGHQDGVSAVAISSDEHWLMTGGRDHVIKLWDLTAENPAATSIDLQGHQDKVRVAAFSPNSQWLVTGSYDSTVRLWSLENNQTPVKPINLRGFEHFIITLDISQDGHWLVAGSVDGNIGLWNLASQDIAITEAVILHTGKTFVSNVAITPDNQWIVSVGQDNSSNGTIQLWSLSLETMLDQARCLAGRHLTLEEWEQYLPGRSYPYQ